jgi:hypothetical protein
MRLDTTRAPGEAPSFSYRTSYRPGTRSSSAGASLHVDGGVAAAASCVSAVCRRSCHGRSSSRSPRPHRLSHVRTHLVPSRGEPSAGWQKNHRIRCGPVRGECDRSSFGSRREGASRQSVTSRLLCIYLQDHHAASAGGVALARRALGPSHPLAKRIARDRDALERVMQQLAVSPSALKVGIVRVAELVGRLKLNGRIFERSPLSSVVELETLVVGVRGKEALWTALQRAGISLESVDLDALVESARAQGAELEALRLSAAARAFAQASGGISGSQAVA